MSTRPSRAGTSTSPLPPMFGERNAQAILTVYEMELERAAARFGAVKPRLSPYIGMTLATLASMHIAEPKPCSRAALMGLPIRTLADALGALSVIEAGVDQELGGRLLKD